MKWSLRLGSLLGIPIYMHVTFLLLLAWIGVVHWTQEHSVRAVASGVGFILAIFLCVVLHELGHALTARRFGIKTRDITLLPIGGLARLERMPDEPVQELWVAVAGPAVNVVIAAALAAWLIAAEALEPLGGLGVAVGPFLQRLFVVNVLLVAFNMIPAFPMDGGRVLRAVLAMRLEYTKATHIASSVGQAFALLFGFAGLFVNPVLIFIALFVWIGAAQEASMVQMKTALGGIPVGRAMLTEFHTLRPSDTLARAVELTLASSQKDFPVVEEARIVGVLVQGDVVAALSASGSATRVGDVMRRDYQVVDPSEMLETVFERLQQCACRTVPVLRHGQLIGLATMDNIGEFIAIKGALAKTGRSA